MLKLQHGCRVASYCTTNAFGTLQSKEAQQRTAGTETLSDGGREHPEKCKHES